MSSTSQKHRNFVAEPMGEKSVSELAGVGEVLGTRLQAAGFDKVFFIENNFYVKMLKICFLFFQAYTVLGQYLILKKDADLFKEWMKDTCNANSKQAADCYQCLNDWCEEFL